MAFCMFSTALSAASVRKQKKNSSVDNVVWYDFEWPYLILTIKWKH